MDINSTCRLCLGSSEEFVCIFDEETLDINPEVFELLEFLQLGILSHDKKSSIMCMKCYVKLLSFKNFRLKCEESEQVWDQMCGDEFAFAMEVNMFDDIKDDEEEEEEDQKPYVVKKTRKKVSTRSSKAKPKAKVFVKEPKLEYIPNEIDVKLQSFYGFMCTTCEPLQKFENLATYKAHMKECHDETSPSIVCCHKKMNSRRQLLDHMSSHAERTLFPCEFCDKGFTYKKGLQAHNKRMHCGEDAKKYQCDYCKKRFVHIQPLQQHLFSHLSEETKEELRTHVCDECGAAFMHKHVLQAHIKFVHLKQGYICDLCARHFKSRFDYELHRRNAHGEEGLPRKQCPTCAQWYSNEKALREHIRYLHEKKQKIICNICGDELSSKQSLRSHRKMKHDAKMHLCSYCTKALPTAIRLKEHEAMHTGVTLYKCFYCPKEFNMRSNMYKHFKALHRNEWIRDKANKNQNPDDWKNKGKIEVKTE